MSQPVDYYNRERSSLLLVVSGPSGVGKDSVVQRMKEREYPVCFVVTATDRPPRPTEIHGRDYFFYTTAEFERMIVRGELLEHACVYGQYKGIPKAHVREALASGQDVIMRLDVFLMCESKAELVSRLRERRTESEEALVQRLKTAQEEMERISDFDYIVFNRRGALDEAVNDLGAILRSEHCRTDPRRISL
jgi:guanylate kinase